MATDVVEQPGPGSDLVAAFRAAAPMAREQRFWLTLGIAFAAHALLLLSIVKSPGREMGDPNAPAEALAVSFVSEAELRDATTGSEGGAPMSPQAPPVTAPPEPQQQPEQAPQQPAEAASAPPQAQPETKTAAVEPAPPKPAAEQATKAETEAAPELPTLPSSVAGEATAERKADESAAKKPDEPVSEAKSLEKTQQELTEAKPDLLQLPDPTAPGPSNNKQQAKKAQKQAMRSPDMTLPGQKTMMTSLEGRTAGIERPAGITRSGANDDFARGVIRALRSTMPQMNVLGRVTVRILINNNGNIQGVEVVSRSDNSDLNRAVVFSTKQASFPFPPNGATEADRTFTITYIYH